MSNNNPKRNKIRVRIAPSPTGTLHIGTARTALFNYLFAKKNEGSFVLRIEDTDLERSDPKWEKDIIDNLKWLGIKWDEGPDVKGEYGPYKQSERLSSYAKYLKKLFKEGKVYHCFCSEDELEAERQYLMSIGEPAKYSGKCREIPEKEVKKRLAEGKKSVIRFKVSGKKMKFKDLIRGNLEFDTLLIGDIAIAKDLATPLYNFAVVVDDFEMKITHVIRGEDHLPNTPKQILIQEALDFPRPEYAHLPLILGSDRSKLSKRHGATAVSDYREDGYLSETIVNFMAFLGWNPGTEREIYSLRSLVKEFSLEKVQKGGAVFNIKRLDYLNGFYIRQKSIKKLAEISIPYLKKAKLIKEDPDIEQLKKIISIYQERLKKLSELPDLVDFFFKDKIEYNKGLLKWKEMTDEEIKDSLDKLEELLSKIKLSNFNKENLEKILLIEAGRMGDRGKLLWPLRAALSGKESSAGPFEIAEILGKEKVLKRIKEAKELIK
mgnify:CR=1 FL=1|tara:strand:- start:39797 stop:41272 length:1476 start_codon:yes stop_codon:yes gene_type:complete